VLYCEQCGCSGELGMGWLSVVRAAVGETEDERLMVEYCPSCAGAVFGYRRRVASEYDRVRAGLRRRGREDV
jgi:hypothetical protein